MQILLKIHNRLAVNTLNNFMKTSLICSQIAFDVYCKKNPAIGRTGVKNTPIRPIAGFTGGNRLYAYQPL